MTPEKPDGGPGPWPLEPVRNYTQDFGLGTPQSAAFDEGLNLWLLDGNRIGVLRPGDTAPSWEQGIGQARAGFGPEAFATGSTVICGGKPGRAYVGYSARQLQSQPGLPSHAYIPSPGEPGYSDARYAEYQKGDLDTVRLWSDGSIVLEEHLWETLKAKDKKLGIHNTNDFRYDEDRSVRACERVTRGPGRGTVYISTNHGVTMIQGLAYNSHRHPGWYREVQRPDGSWGLALQTTEMYGLGIATNGDVLVANEQMVGVLVPNGKLADFDRELGSSGPVPWRFKGYNHQLNSQADEDAWRAFEQATSGIYYLGSATFGLWSLKPVDNETGSWARISALPSSHVRALQATDDGAVYIGTDDAGLWRLEPDGVRLTQVAEVPGTQVRTLSYEPTVDPSMLLVVTDAGVTVLRGP
jgi:hypothetical protein